MARGILSVLVMAMRLARSLAQRDIRSYLGTCGMYLSEKTKWYSVRMRKTTKERLVLYDYEVVLGTDMGMGLVRVRMSTSTYLPTYLPTLQ